MDYNNPPPPGEGMPGGLNEIGHFNNPPPPGEVLPWGQNDVVHPQNPPPPGEEMPSGRNEIGHLYHRGISNNSFNASAPPRFWRPPLLSTQFSCFGGARPFPFPPGPPPCLAPGILPGLPRGVPGFPPGPFLGCGPPVFNVPPPTHTGQIDKSRHTKTDDEVWLTNWLKSRPFKQRNCLPDKNGVTPSQAKEKLKAWLNLLNDLEEKRSILLGAVDTLSDEEWNTAWNDIREAQASCTSLIGLFSSEMSLVDLQKKLMKQARKRARLKRQHIEQRKDVYLAQLRRQRLHQKADAWLADMQQAVDKARKEEELKREADSVLAEVTRRQSEGRRQIALLESLQKLHKTRLQTMESRGSNLSTEDKQASEHSTSVFNHLLALWLKKMEEYGKEEHGLRVMLEESAAKQGDLEIQNVRRILMEWESCLFGSENSLKSDEPYDTDTLISIRYAWDQFIVPDGVALPMASKIPVGWVLPTTPSSSEWQKLLMTT